MLFNRNDRKTVIKAHHLNLKSEIVSFIVSFKKKYEKFPIKDLGRVSRISYSNIKKMMISGVAMEPKVAVNEIKKRYTELGKKLKASYFNPILRSFKKDALKCDIDKEEKEIFSSYKIELKSEFKQMDMDLLFCLEGLKEVTKVLHEINKEEDTEE